MSEETSARREEIKALLDTIHSADYHAAQAQVLALLEIADAIDRLAGEIEKAGWKKG